MRMAINSVWRDWRVVRLIGQGSFGDVYEIHRELPGITEKAALKVITVPKDSSEIQTLYSDGYDNESITQHFRDCKDDILKEYGMMAKLKGCHNVVHCEDLETVQHRDGPGWDIYIRMELMTPLTQILDSRNLSEGEIIDLGCDICSALVKCEAEGIIHRDIKPQNILVSDDGTCKIGDFGVAKIVEGATGGKTKVGTYKYMAPEIYNNQPYGSSADLYSLGLVLYWLLNERRTPFLPLPPERITVLQDSEARVRRFAGETLPPPAHGSSELKRIVLKACAFDPKDRYHSAKEMLHELQTIKANFYEATVILTEPKTQPFVQPEPQPVSEEEPASSRSIPDNVEDTSHTPKKKTVLFICAAVCALIVLVIILASTAAGKQSTQAYSNDEIARLTQFAENGEWEGDSYFAGEMAGVTSSYFFADVNNDSLQELIIILFDEHNAQCLVYGLENSTVTLCTSFRYYPDESETYRYAAPALKENYPGLAMVIAVASDSGDYGFIGFLKMVDGNLSEADYRITDIGEETDTLSKLGWTLPNTYSCQ